MLGTAVIGAPEEVDRAGKPARPMHRRVTVRALLVGIVGLAAVLLVRRLRSTGPALVALTQADPGWLAGVVAVAVCTYFVSAIGLRAASARPLPLGRTVAAQLAAAFANRLTVGGAGGVVTNVRYLEDMGSTRAEAVSALSVQWLVRLAVHTAAIVILASVTGLTLPVALSMPDPPAWSVVVAAAVVGFAVAGLARWGVPRCRRALAFASRVLALGVATARNPRRLAVLVGCAATSTVASTLGLVMALHAVGAGPPVAGIAAVYVVSSAAAALIPTPGGIGTVEAALVAGVIGFGMNPGPALAGVLIFRLVAYLLGLVGGAVAYRHLRLGRPADHDEPVVIRLAPAPLA